VTQSSTNHIRLSRDCGTSVFSFTPFITAVDSKVCPATVLPYTAPAVTISDSTSVYSYTADYTETLPVADIQTDSISSGTFLVHAHAAATQVPAQPPFAGPIQLNASSTTSLLFQTLDGLYQVNVTGLLSITLPKSGRGFFVTLNVGGVPVPATHCAIPVPLTSINLSQCVLNMSELDVLKEGGPAPGTSFVVPFTFSGIVGTGINPSTGEFYSRGFAINPSVTAMANPSAQAANATDVTVSVNVAFTRIQ